MLNKQQLISELSEIGVESGSTFVNSFNLLFIFILVIIAHLLLILLPRKSIAETENMSKPKKVFFYISRNLWIFFTFALYIRLILEAYQYILLSSVYEIYTFDISSTSKIVSFGIACSFALFCVLCFLFVLFMTLCIPIKHLNIKSKWAKFSVFNGFYSGIKDKKFQRLYTPLLLLRRIVFISWLIIFRSFTNTFIVLGLFIVQLSYMVSLFSLRPYKGVKDNLIEWINEIFYAVLLCNLFYFNSTARWSDLVTKIYVWIMMANNIVLILIITCKPYDFLMI